MSSKPNWLNRNIAAPGPFLTLCLSEREFLAAAKHCRVASPGHWIKTQQADATAHHWVSDRGLATVVCLRGHEERSPVEIAGLLVHEAVHAWQEYADYYGETCPGREQMAYGIQSLAQELMAEFSRRLAAA
jgi:hypothetical protein